MDIKFTYYFFQKFFIHSPIMLKIIPYSTYHFKIITGIYAKYQFCNL